MKREFDIKPIEVGDTVFVVTVPSAKRNNFPDHVKVGIVSRELKGIGEKKKYLIKYQVHGCRSSGWYTGKWIAHSEVEWVAKRGGRWQSNRLKLVTADVVLGMQKVLDKPEKL